VRRSISERGAAHGRAARFSVQGNPGSEEESISFLKKRNKKLLFDSVRNSPAGPGNKRLKVFWFFFSKKNCFF
jgi:hypothetical protein